MNIPSTKTECPWCGEPVWQRFSGQNYIDTHADGSDHVCPVNEGINVSLFCRVRGPSVEREAQVLEEVKG